MAGLNEMSDQSAQPRGPRPAARAPGAPTLRVGRLSDALEPNELGNLRTEDLIGFLAPRRWFGAKAGSPTTAGVRDVVRLPWENGCFAIARLEVGTADGQTALYQLPLCARDMEAIGDEMP